jgi:FdhD protein
MQIVSERQVTLTVNNETWLTFMCTPSDLEALAAGFLYNEQIIQTKHDIASLRVCPEGDNIDVWLNYSVKKPEEWTRTSGCSGGHTSLSKKTSRTPRKQAKNGFVISPEAVGQLMRQLLGAQELYRQSGGVHSSVLCDGEKIVLSAEDIGRHNTLDKLAGKCLLDAIQLTNAIILTTGRISSEMIQKAGRMGAVLVISRTSPSSLSITMARQLGITLIGYARGEEFTIYTFPERVQAYQSGERT